MVRLQKLRQFLLPLLLFICCKIQFLSSSWQPNAAGTLLDKYIDEHQLKNRCEHTEEREIRQCLEPMLAYANAIQLEDEFGTVSSADVKLNLASPSSSFHPHSNTHRQHFSLQGGAVFRHLCALYTNFNACTESVKCFSPSMRAVEASYGYMCGAGHAAFEKYAACFGEVENREQYVHCKRTASRAMDRATAELGDSQNANGNGGRNGGGIDGEQYMDALCHAMDEYLHCCRPFVLEMCGMDAWQLVAKITRESLRVSLPNCNLEMALAQQKQRQQQKEKPKSGGNEAADDDNEWPDGPPT